MKIIATFIQNGMIYNIVYACLHIVNICKNISKGQKFKKKLLCFKIWFWLNIYIQYFILFTVALNVPHLGFLKCGKLKRCMGKVTPCGENSGWAVVGNELLGSSPLLPTPIPSFITSYHLLQSHLTQFNFCIHLSSHLPKNHPFLQHPRGNVSFLATPTPSGNRSRYRSTSRHFIDTVEKRPNGQSARLFIVRYKIWKQVTALSMKNPHMKYFQAGLWVRMQNMKLELKRLCSDTFEWLNIKKT